VKKEARECLDGIDWLGPEVSPLRWKFDLTALVRDPTPKTRALVFVIDGSVADEQGVLHPVIRFSSPWMLKQFQSRLLEVNREFGKMEIRAKMLWKLIGRSRAMKDSDLWSARERAFHETVAGERVVLRECGRLENEFELQQATAYVFEEGSTEKDWWFVGHPDRPEEQWKRWSLCPPVQTLARLSLRSEDAASLYVPAAANFPAVDSIYFDRRAKFVLLLQHTLQKDREIEGRLVEEVLDWVVVPKGFRTVLAFVRPSNTGTSPTRLHYIPPCPEWKCLEVDVGNVTDTPDCLSIWNCVYDEPVAESLARALDLLQADEEVSDFAG
jgi:hypothetical protein